MSEDGTHETTQDLLDHISEKHNMNSMAFCKFLSEKEINNVEILQTTNNEHENSSREYINRFKKILGEWKTHVSISTLWWDPDGEQEKAIIEKIVSKNNYMMPGEKIGFTLLVSTSHEKMGELTRTDIVDVIIKSITKNAIGDNSHKGKLKANFTLKVHQYAQRTTPASNWNHSKIVQ